MEKKIRCVLVGAALGMQPNILLKHISKSQDYIIAVDGGLAFLQQAKIEPDMVIGDFDSFLGTLPNSVKMMRLPREKDDTDMMAAVNQGLQLGFRSFLILGGLGARIDHTYANLCILKFLAEQRIEHQLLDDKTECFMLTKGERWISNRRGDTISVFPFGNQKCVLSYSGLEYGLEKEELDITMPRGISNRVISDKAQIIVHSGSALIIFIRDQNSR